MTVPGLLLLPLLAAAGILQVRVPALPAAPSAAPAVERRELHVCVLSPRVEAGPGGKAVAVVPLARPTLFAAGDYAAIRLEREGQPPWSLESSALDPIHGPLGWPLAPLRPGERVLLRLRPAGAGREDFATILLIGAPAATLAGSETLLRRLGDDPDLWLAAVEKALAERNLDLVQALLFAVEGPSSPELDALRLEVFHRSCGAAAVAAPFDGRGKPGWILRLLG